ncbi:Polyphosphate:AMP phosphotransferase [Gammaproteobacteria bacterium]
MFEATKLGRTVSKEAFKTQVDILRAQLLEVQRALRETRTAVIVLVAGVDGAGKGEVVNCLNEWLDTRGVQTFAFWGETDEERERPHYWRFWRTLPPRGQIAILFSGWYQAPIEQRFDNLCSDAELDAELNRIVDLERMLIQDGALILKFWFHLPEKVQQRRLKELARDDRSRWKMRGDKAKFAEGYRRFEEIAERVIRHTDRGISPWYLIEATDRRYRDLTVGRTLQAAIQARIDQPPDPSQTPTSHAPKLPDEPSARVTILDHLDLDQTLSPKEYKARLQKRQAEANELAWAAYKAKRSCVMVFEGVDAAGKGGAIRRITEAIDARLYRTIQVAAPTDEERAHHYLWRFWNHIPRAGRITIYDRSWYGRVLVERVEGFAAEPDWHRAYAEINAFEDQLLAHGAIILKFWMQIGKEEQLQRFKAREQVAYKQHKITEEDWRNRERWDDYQQAVNEMVIRTSTEHAPWTLIGGNDKLHARIAVIEAVCQTLRHALQDKNAPGSGHHSFGNTDVTV